MDQPRQKAGLRQGRAESGNADDSALEQDPGIAGIQNANGRVPCHHEQVFVSRHQHVGLSNDRRSQHGWIIRISHLRTEKAAGIRHHCVFAEIALDLDNLPKRHPKPLPQDASEFREVDLPGEKFMLRKDQAEQVGTHSAGRVRTDEDIRVEEDLQETSRKTSSSVRYPRASA